MSVPSPRTCGAGPGAAALPLRGQVLETSACVPEVDAVADKAGIRGGGTALRRQRRRRIDSTASGRGSAASRCRPRTCSRSRGERFGALRPARRAGPRMLQARRVRGPYHGREDGNVAVLSTALYSRRVFPHLRPRRLQTPRSGGPRALSIMTESTAEIYLRNPHSRAGQNPYVPEELLGSDGAGVTTRADSGRACRYVVRGP